MIYENSLKGIAQWACRIAKVDFEKLHPDMVKVNYVDGKPYSVMVNHPDMVEPMLVEIGEKRQ